MGLDTSHDCWHGSYVLFRVWRTDIARALNIDLDKMEGHTKEDVEPILWSSIPSHPVIALLHHSDCDGSIPWRKCRAIADGLESLILLGIPGRARTEQFIRGLRLAYVLKQNVTFG
jgi:hypothetical protein